MDYHILLRKIKNKPSDKIYRLKNRNKPYIGRRLKIPVGTQEELANSAAIANKLLYKIINYSTELITLPRKAVEEEKRLLTFLRQGPRAGYHAFNRKSKLTSADVLYILISSVQVPRLAELFNVHPQYIRDIRAGKEIAYDFEYWLYKKIYKLVRHNMRRYRQLKKDEDFGKYVYVCEKVTGISTKELLFIANTEANARVTRVDILLPADYERMVNRNTLDILYPITKTSVIF